jgi:hypothetical protein
MQRREQYLLIGLVGAVLFWQGLRLLDSTFLGPMRDKQKELTKLEETVDQRMKELVVLARQRKNLVDWKRRSLPTDKTTKRQRNDRPEALNAQRLYQDWLHDLAQLSGFEDLKVQPDRLSVSRDNVFVSVGIKIEGEARFEQLCRFLGRFYRADMLHRVTSLRVQSRESEGDPFLQIALEAEGLAVVGSPEKRLLFPRATLTEDAPDDATELKIEAAEGFPKEPGFLVRMRDEFLRVTAIDGTTWTVERAQDGTTAASHPAGTFIESMPMLPDMAPRSPEEIKQLLETNIFVKPAPPMQYKPRIAPLGEKILVRGKPLEFNIVVLGYDPAKGRPEFSLVAPIPAGSRLDKASGKFAWAPTADQKAGKYPFKFEVKHPSAPGGLLADSVTITLRDPNLAPKISPKTAPPVYIGREWKFKPEATDAETPANKLVWKLGENPPKGLVIDGKTGELTWTPDDETEPGEATIPLVVTDDGATPQSTTLVLKVKVQDDAATFTHLTTIFIVDGKVLAKLYDRSQDKYTDLRVGTRFAVADMAGTVTQIDKKYLMYADKGVMYRLEIGQSLREVSAEPTPVADEIPDATRPANVGSDSDPSEPPT